MRRILIVSLAFSAVACSTGEDVSGGDASSAGPSATPTVHVDQLLAEDFSDVPTLMKWSDRVVAGTPIEDLGPVFWEGSQFPGTLYRVRVDDAFGATVPDELLVYQGGGYDAEEKTVFLANGDPLLEVGKQYMLSGRTGGPKDAMVLVPDYGTVSADDPRVAALAAAATTTVSAHSDSSLPSPSGRARKR